MTNKTITFRRANTPSDFGNGKQLFRQYIQSLNFALTFQDVDRELEEIAMRIQCANRRPAAGP